MGGKALKPHGSTNGIACETIFRGVKAEILAGKLKPGQKLRQEELARRYGISRTPVRDALKKLEAEGLVTFQSNRYATLPQLDLGEFKEVYSIRGVLEPLAARLAAPRLTEKNLEHLTDLVKRMEEASRLDELGNWLILDYEFHHSLFKPSDSPRLLKLISSFWNSSHHFRRAYCKLPGRIQKAEKMHCRLLAAAEARDEEMLALLTRTHIQDSLNGILEVQPRELSSHHPPVAERSSLKDMDYDLKPIFTEF